MDFPVLVRKDKDQFTAHLVGEVDVAVAKPTRDEALEAMSAELRDRFDRGELVSVPLAPGGIMSLFGKYAGDETLREICDEIYADRNRDRDGLKP